ncbi:MAG: (2Fe-2S)-binding protein, partial [Vicinamibacterales bacterium]
MSTTYRLVGWNATKRRYDAIVIGLMTTLAVTFAGLQAFLRPELTVETVLIRSLGLTAFTAL